MMTVTQTLDSLGYTGFGDNIREHEDGRMYFNVYYYGNPTAKMFISPDVLKYMEDFLLSVGDILDDTTVEAIEIGEYEYAIISIPVSTM